MNVKGEQISTAPQDPFFECHIMGGAIVALGTIQPQRDAAQLTR
jgi:hypothetical protein